MRRLPPLGALQSFEVASRTLSFTRAAEELNLTPAAVSHQIRTLEARLGITLFRRENNKILLTDRGQAYLPTVREALGLIARATARIGEEDASRVLNLSVLPTFAVRWLIPRLMRFQEAFPGIEIRLSTTYRSVDFAVEDYDAAVRYGTGSWQGLTSYLLFTEELVPVCSPKLLEGRRRPRKPDDLAGYTLIHSETCLDNWRIWLQTVGAHNVDPESGIRFDSCLLKLQAAQHCMGFTVATREYVKDDLAAGTLVAPFDAIVPQPFGWYFVSPTATAAQPKIATFRKWLLGECSETPEAAEPQAGPARRRVAAC